MLHSSRNHVTKSHITWIFSSISVFFFFLVLFSHYSSSTLNSLQSPRSVEDILQSPPIFSKTLPSQSRSSLPPFPSIFWASALFASFHLTFSSRDWSFQAISTSHPFLRPFFSYQHSPAILHTQLFSQTCILSHEWRGSTQAEHSSYKLTRYVYISHHGFNFSPTGCHAIDAGEFIWRAVLLMGSVKPFYRAFLSIRYVLRLIDQLCYSRYRSLRH